MKKLVSVLLALVFVLVCPLSAAFAAEPLSGDALQAAFDEEMHQARYITQRGAAYEYQSFQEYLSYWFQQVWTNTDRKKKSITEVENGAEMVETLKTLRESLVQVADPESVSWYIWGDNMAQAADADSYDYTCAYDEAGFKPFLVPYMLKDQTKVKGNIIIVAGGAFNQRCNDNEGDPVAVYWNQKGYNCFVLQRRIAPSQPIDSSLDLQRAIRYIRYYAQEKGIAKTDKIVTMGFSGGGMTILNQLNTCYGDLLPSVVYSDYVADDIDKVNSDYDVAVVMYGVGSDNYESANPNMPALFLFGGEIDNKVSPINVAKLYITALEHGWPVEMYGAGDTHHGIGIMGVRAFSNVGYTNSLPYREALETYLDVRLGYKSATFTPCACRPVCECADGACTCEGCQLHTSGTQNKAVALFNKLFK